MDFGLALMAMYPNVHKSQFELIQQQDGTVLITRWDSIDMQKPTEQEVIDFWNNDGELKYIKSQKVAELDTMCNQTILGNFPVIIGDTLYYFPNDDTAQKNFDKFLLAFSSGLANEPENFTCYDENGKVCRVAFDAKSFISLYKAHLIHIASNIALFRDYLELKVDNCESIDEINAINWLTLLFGQTYVSIGDSSEMNVALSLEGTLYSEVTTTADLS